MPTVNVYRDGKLHVRAEQCGNCLYSKDRLVDGARARDITAETRGTEGGSFVCHRSQVSDEPEAVCSVWFDRFAEEDAIMRLAIAADIVERI